MQAIQKRPFRGFTNLFLVGTQGFAHPTHHIKCRVGKGVERRAHQKN